MSLLASRIFGSSSSAEIVENVEDTNKPPPNIQRTSFPSRFDLNRSEGPIPSEKQSQSEPEPQLIGSFLMRPKPPPPPLRNVESQAKISRPRNPNEQFFDGIYGSSNVEKVANVTGEIVRSTAKEISYNPGYLFKRLSISDVDYEPVTDFGLYTPDVYQTHLGSYFDTASQLPSLPKRNNLAKNSERLIHQSSQRRKTYRQDEEPLRRSTRQVFRPEKYGK